MSSTTKDIDRQAIAEKIRAALREMNSGTGEGDTAAREILRGILADLEQEPEAAASPELKIGDRVTVDWAKARQLHGTFAVTTGTLSAITDTGDGLGPLDRIGTVTSDSGDVESHVPMPWLRPGGAPQ